MKDQELEIKAALQVMKPAAEIFEAIVDPDAMRNYFISYGSSRMEDGKTITWRFPEFDMEFPIIVDKLEKDRYISYRWDANESNKTLVEITLSAGKNNGTVVTVTEKSLPNNEAGMKWLKGNTEGWANFLACLKAWMEYGINLRKGGFDHLS